MTLLRQAFFSTLPTREWIVWGIPHLVLQFLGALLYGLHCGTEGVESLVGNEQFRLIVCQFLLDSGKFLFKSRDLCLGYIGIALGSQYMPTQVDELGLFRLFSLRKFSSIEWSAFTRFSARRMFACSEASV